jgi:signal transduction histidine kinase
VRFARLIAAARAAAARRTVRLRLTLLYTALFLTAGAALLGVTYGLVARSLADNPSGTQPAVGEPAPGVLTKPSDPAFNPADLCRSVTNHAGCKRAVAEGMPIELVKACRSPIDPGLARKCRSAFTEGFSQGATTQRDRTLHKLLLYSLLALAAMTLVSAGLGWLMAGRVLRPVHAITAAARRASQENLSERIALTGPDDELKRLADTFDAMLERLDGAFAGKRDFVANASHELRTPLTLMRTAIDVTLAKPDRTTEQLEAMAVDVRGAVDRSEALIDGLLTLARSDSATTAREAVDLAAIAEDALELAVAHTPNRSDIAIEAILSDAPAVGDRVLLERLAANLIDNATAYNVPRGWVRVTTGTRNGAAFLEVSNSGPPVAPDDVASLFEPFRRLDGRAGVGGEAGAEGPGVGLGLSIVRAVATMHEARLDARARPAGGLEMTVELAQGE